MCVWNTPGTHPVCPEAPAPFLVALGMQQLSLGDPLLSTMLPTCLVPTSRSEFTHGPSLESSTDLLAGVTALPQPAGHPHGLET